MIRETDINVLVLSSAIAGCCSGVFTNVLEVIKTQVMNEVLSGSHNHGRLTFAHKIKHSCHCYYCFLRDLFKKDGARTVFRGIGYNTMMSAVRSSVLFPMYEYLLRMFQAHSQGLSPTLSALLPGVAGFTSKLLSIGLTFPLEYLATLSQAGKANQHKNMTHGFGFTLYRELLYSACFWSIQDRLYKRLRQGMQSDRRAYTTSSFLSSMLSAVVSYPFDLFKTWKISYPEKFKNSHALGVTRQIFNEKGPGVLLAGLVPRMIRVGIGNLIFFSVYTHTVETIRNKQ